MGDFRALLGHLVTDVRSPGVKTPHNSPASSKQLLWRRRDALVVGKAVGNSATGLQKAL
jgi:hypothetical protein